jgi:hypothetical protein
MNESSRVDLPKPPTDGNGSKVTTKKGPEMFPDLDSRLADAVEQMLDRLHDIVLSDKEFIEVCYKIEKHIANARLVMEGLY